MTKTITKIFSVLTFCLFFLNTGSLKAQDDIDQFLAAGIQDANTLVEGYVKPLMVGFGSGLGGGWYNTAKAHKTAGFDLTVTVNAAYIPSSDRFYTPNLVNATYNPSGPDRSPTLFGPEDENLRPQYDYSYTEAGQTFNGTITGPPGLAVKDNIGFEAVPVPMVQLGIGIVKNTDLKIRWSPKIDIGDDGEFKLLGFALMHDIKQHIPGIKDLPFDLSFLAGFTKITADYGLQASTGNISSNNSVAEYGVNTWTFQGIISKKFSVITFYGGLGYNASKSTVALKGEYVLQSDIPGETRTFTDPIDLKFNQNGPRLTAGMRLKLAIITFHADYTVQKYDVLSVGFGFNVR
ncbi:MAG TPA: hypothetical protein PKL31_07435 [Fulvivirga sp.]|nr:hypothetical protein [Fulvivirga sp.]